MNTTLPVELILYISDFLDPFQKYNFFTILNIQELPKFKIDFQNSINHFCEYDNVLIQQIMNFINVYNLTDSRILTIIRDLYFIINTSRKYTDILGYTLYKFIVFRNFTEKDHINYVFQNDIYEIHIFFDNPGILCKYLDVFFQMKNIHHTYSIKHYNMKKLLSINYS